MAYFAHDLLLGFLTV